MIRKMSAPGFGEPYARVLLFVATCTLSLLSPLPVNAAQNGHPLTREQLQEAVKATEHPLFTEHLKVSSFLQKRHFYNVIRELQPKVERREPISSFLLFALATAYGEIRDYKKMLHTVGLLESKINSGDRGGLVGDLTPYPRILRGQAHLELGEYDRAVRNASAALTIVNQAGSDNLFQRAQIIRCAELAGIANAQQNNYHEADRYMDMLREVDIYASNLGPEKYMAMAKIHMAKREFREALKIILDPSGNVVRVDERLLREIPYGVDYAFQEIPRYFILMKCLYETGRITEARNGYDHLLKHPRISESGGIYWLILLDRARIARADQNPAMAENLLKEAVEVIEKQRSSITSEAGRIGFVGDKQAIYGQLVSLLVEQERPEEAFEFAERAKGRALVDLLASQKIIPPSTTNGPQIGATMRKLAKAEQELSIVTEQGDPADLGKKRGDVVRLKGELTAEAPELASLVSVSAATGREIRERLWGDETLLEYFTAEGEWYVFVVNRKGVRAKKLTAKTVESDLRHFRRDLMDPDSANYRKAGKALYESLIAPVEEALGTGQIVIVPHGVLHYLPFSALCSPEGFLIDRFTVHVLPVASVLRYVVESHGKLPRTALIIGNPDLGDPRFDLRFAQEEALSIAAIMGRSKVLLRKKARADYVLRNGNRYYMIHFAGHGIFDPTNPLNSALLLVGDKGKDGRLRAADLYYLRLNADLVTLSACETALGKISGGDDIVGFTRGFLYAGARSIVSSLWEVDDLATRELMVGFYRRIPLMAKDEALRAAQLEVRKRYPHPYFWASFQLTGAGR